MDRRGVTDSGSGRGDTYAPWFRNPSKIHKPGKKKLRRYMPHLSGAGRSAQLSKPDSPILSRIGYHSMERAAPRHDMGSAPLGRSGPIAPVGKMGADGGSRYGSNSPTVHERDSSKRTEKGPRTSKANATGGGISGSDLETAAHQGRSPVGDSTGSSLGNVVRKSPGGAPNSGDDNRALSGSVGARKVTAASNSVKNPAEQGERQNGTRRNLAEGAKPEPSRDPMNDHKPKWESNSAMVGLSREKYTSGTKNSFRKEGKAELRKPSSLDQHAAPTSDGGVNRPKARVEVSGNGVAGSTSIALASRNERSVPDRGNSARGPAMERPKLSAEQNRANRVPEKCVENEAPKKVGDEGNVIGARSPLRQSTPRTGPVKRERPTDDRLPNGDKESLQAGSVEKGEKVIRNANRVLMQPGKPEVQEGRSPMHNDNHFTFESHVNDRPPLSPMTSNSNTIAAEKMVTTGSDTARESAKLNCSTSRPQALESIPRAKPHIERNGGMAVIQEPGQVAVNGNSPSVKRGKEQQMPRKAKQKNSLERRQGSEGSKEKMVMAGEGSSAQVKVESERAQNAPVLPVVELRAALSSKGGHPKSSTLQGRRNASLVLPGFLSALNPSALNQPNDFADPATPVTAKSGKGSQPAPLVTSNLRSTPVPKSPISVPEPALSLLRSSPRYRPRSSPLDCRATPQSSLVSPEPMQIVADTDTQQGKLTEESGAPTGERSKLVNQIHAFDERIRALERRLAQKRASISIETSADGATKSAADKAGQAEDAQKQKIAVIAREIAEREEEAEDAVISPHPSLSSLRLILSRNKSVAAASRALLRPLCHDPEKGLTDVHAVNCEMLRPLSEDRRANVAAEIRRRKAEAVERSRNKRKEYRALREAWERKIKLARDKRSKEKREMMKERDRFLVMCTKGQSALLSSRTSSGRMSTKIFPSLNVNGQTNTNAEVDALLASIASEGGTPGLKEVWSKTLADIPAQNPRNIPCDSGSVWVEDPLQDFYASRAVNPWRFQEKLIFLDKYAMYPKNFRKIAGFLEYKTTQDCSAFYYQHKLDLGLKQLAKEASTMKRKGILKPHIVNLARKRPTHDSEQVISSVIHSFLSSSHGSTGMSNHDRSLVAGDSPLQRKANETQKGEAATDKRKLVTANLGFKKRIISESGALDLSGISREAFMHALSNHGHKWHLIARTMALPGKSSSHYREFYKRNKRRLRLSDVDRTASKSGSGKSPAATHRQSPIISPKSFPKSLPLPSEEEGRPSTELDTVMFDTSADANVRSKESVETSSPKQLSPKPASSPGSYSPMDVEKKNARGHVQTGHRGSAKTATWTKEDRERFKQLFKKHRRDWKKIAELLPPKTPAQVKGYWRKVAHEVGNGFPSHSGKISKSERKRSRRAQSSDGSGGTDGKRHAERKSSPQKPSPVASTEAGKKRTEESGKEYADNTATNFNVKKEGMAAPAEQKSLERKESETLIKRNGIDDNARSEETVPDPQPSSDTRRGPEPGGSSDSLGGKLADGRLSNGGRAPSLRSTLMPLLRSMPVKDVQSSISGDNAGGKRGDKESEKKVDGQGSKQDRLRRAAESYGVLELLDGTKGDRLERGAK
eukprot:GFKZ01008606.1.p1 GENE.GFKZ01008606.1~~GFKZ01008606.1.p1  ORF type:complete len:1597 (+),score=227.01 GFKZ01008606.1:2609-7399(+)